MSHEEIGPSVSLAEMMRAYRNSRIKVRYLPYPTSDQTQVARTYLRECILAGSGDPERAAEIDDLDPEEVQDRIVRLWPQGWEHFCTRHSAEIAAAFRDQERQWHIEAEEAARGRWFASRLPAAAWVGGRCSPIATESVRCLGADIVQMRREYEMSWQEIADRLEVPVFVAVAWAIESRIRPKLAGY